ncbi:PEP/pyruvate-binding domain-containing protein [Rhodococcus sp. IEGM 1318]|uniref:PEP/pyruvate-binding domain-containing protein n=1 Tax=Rhodococcus sp. IEGM 1318 TaxID=3082226 RepID=UPI0029550705|nr:PEP/pyruvate-binding domain-containing protein [Rhodococcus sp. IEGM 1318]MDV8009352.1 PEP/pyruvate-binding domain-containing protein [Rhodococcus sp. IEGM 1318]
MTDAPYICFFDADVDPLIEDLGGKCASLVTMTGAGMPVPPGFAVTTAGYQRFVDHTGITEETRQLLAGLDPDDVAQVDQVSGRIREMICSCTAPADLTQSIVDAHGELQRRFATQTPVAIRSSATAEDLPGASFAGQQDTYLWITGIDAVRESIRRCWASLYTSRAILYRLKHEISDEGLRMAVAVQKMVNARVAGVAITMNPTNGDRSKIAVDASYGVGEMVVSGLVTPDNILLDKVMLTVVSETVGDKHAELVPDFGTGELVEREVDAERRARRSLTPDELTAVAAMAKRAEKHYLCPQDIEWALDHDLPDGQNLLLLQSRPETVHSSKAEPTAAAPPTAAPTNGFSLSSMTATLTHGLPKS